VVFHLVKLSNPIDRGRTGSPRETPRKRRDGPLEEEQAQHGAPAGAEDFRPAADRDAAPDAPDDLELVERARNDDPLAVDLLLRRYQQKVFNIAYSLCGFDPEEAQDTAQEALLRIFRSLKHFEGRSRFSTWLHRVAVNACLDARRRRRRWLRFISPRPANDSGGRGSDDGLEHVAAAPDGEDAVAGISREELKRDVRRALKGLSEKQQTVFQLKVFQEMSIPEIASATGMAEGTVKSHLFRATQSIRSKLRRWVEP
jgi:RNA polymerase sigma-70 factor (ECF subfamily)